MTNPMLEKLARALARHRYHNTPDTEWLDRYVDADWPNRIDEVRVVLMALRKPDEGMIAAADRGGLVNCSDEIADEWRTEYRHIFTAMIDHILEGDTK